MENSKWALVTGASSGIGRGIAVWLGKLGFGVVVNHFNEVDGAEETARLVREAGGGAEIVFADVGEAEQVDAMFGFMDQKCGRIDVLVNNAGVQTWASLLSLKEEDWDRTIKTNLKGNFLCTQSAGRRMVQQGSGCIINIGSGANRVPYPSLVDYCASKGGIEMLTKVAAAELGPMGIRVNCVAPGAIENERTKLESPDYAKTWAALTPMRRCGHVGDIAATVGFLVSDEASFISGQTLFVDGGLWSRNQWPYEDENTL